MQHLLWILRWRESMRSLARALPHQNMNALAGSRSPALPLSLARIVAKMAALVNKKNATVPIWRFFGFKPNERSYMQISAPILKITTQQTTQRCHRLPPRWAAGQNLLASRATNPPSSGLSRRQPNINATVSSGKTVQGQLRGTLQKKWYQCIPLKNPLSKKCLIN